MITGILLKLLYQKHILFPESHTASVVVLTWINNFGETGLVFRLNHVHWDNCLVIGTAQQENRVCHSDFFGPRYKLS